MNNIDMNEIDITTVLYKLMDLGITGIQVYYEGGGDSGAIDSIGYTKDVNFTLDTAHNYFDDYGLNQELNIDDKALNKIEKVIEDLANENILTNLEDWWNNEGGYGNLYIEVPSGQYCIYNNIRIINTETYLHEGSITEKI
jgi:hypothetical protein